jgi:hypothetical protein
MCGSSFMHHPDPSFFLSGRKHGPDSGSVVWHFPIYDINAAGRPTGEVPRIRDEVCLFSCKCRDSSNPKTSKLRPTNLNKTPSANADKSVSARGTSTAQRHHGWRLEDKVYIHTTFGFVPLYCHGEYIGYAKLTQNKCRLRPWSSCCLP